MPSVSNIDDMFDNIHRFLDGFVTVTVVTIRFVVCAACLIVSVVVCEAVEALCSVTTPTCASDGGATTTGTGIGGAGAGAGHSAISAVIAGCTRGGWGGSPVVDSGADPLDGSASARESGNAS